MAIDDAAFKEAILNADLDTLDKFINEYEYEDEDEPTEEVNAKKDEAKDKPDDDIVDDKAKEGEEGEEKKPLDTDVDIKDDKPDVVEVGDTSSLADIAENLLEKISFDENGNAIIPKELLAVISKDGKHEIPYGVLESTRTKAKDAHTALEEEKRLRQEAEGKLTKHDRQAELLKKQLSAAGIDPEQLPEDIEITPELIDSLGEYGDMGKVLKAVIAKQGIATETKPTASEATPDPRYDDFITYKADHAEFAKIMDNEGSDEQETLEHFYSQVTKSSAFKDKPLSEQLDEVMVRTNRSLGVEPIEPASDPDENKAIALQKAQEARESTTPASPSEVGLVDSGKIDNLTRARSASGAELLNIMSELTPKELDTLFDEMD